MIPHLYNPKKFPLNRLPTYQYVAKNILLFAERFTYVAAKISAILQLLEREPLAPQP